MGNRFADAEVPLGGAGNEISYLVLGLVDAPHPQSDALSTLGKPAALDEGSVPRCAVHREATRPRSKRKWMEAILCRAGDGTA